MKNLTTALRGLEGAVKSANRALSALNKNALAEQKTFNAAVMAETKKIHGLLEDMERRHMQRINQIRSKQGPATRARAGRGAGVVPNNATVSQIERIETRWNKSVAAQATAHTKAQEQMAMASQESVAKRIRSLGRLDDAMRRQRMTMRDYQNALGAIRRDSRGFTEDMLLHSTLSQGRRAGSATGRSVGAQAPAVAAQTSAMVGSLDTQKLAMAQALRVQKAYGESLVNIGKNAQWTGRQITMGLTMPIGLVAAGLAMAGLEYDRQLIRIQKVSNEIPEMLGVLEDKSVDFASRMATRFGTMANDSLEVVAAFAQQGRTMETGLFEASEETLRIAKLGEISNEVATELFRSTQTVFDLSMEETSDALNRFNLIENETSLNLKDLAANLPIVATIAADLGMSAEQTAASLAVMREAGVQANVAATALRNSLARLTDATDPARESFSALGIDLDTIFAQNGNNAMKVLESLSFTFQRLEQQGRSTPALIQAFSELFGVRQASRIRQLTKGLVEMGEEGTAAARAFEAAGADASYAASRALREEEAMVESASGTFDRLKSELLIQLQEAGRQVLPLINQMVSGVKTFVSVIVDIADKIGSFFNSLGPLQGIAEMFAKISGVVVFLAGPLITLSGIMKNFFGSSISMFASLIGRTTGAEMAMSKLELALARANEELAEGAVKGNVTKDVVRSLGLAADMTEDQLMGMNAQLAKLNAEEAKYRGRGGGFFGGVGVGNSARTNKNIRNSVGIGGGAITGLSIISTLTNSLDALREGNFSLRQAMISLGMDIAMLAMVMRASGIGEGILSAVGGGMGRAGRTVGGAVTGAGRLAIRGATGGAFGTAAGGAFGIGAVGTVAAATAGLAVLGAAGFAAHKWWSRVAQRVDTSKQLATELADNMGLAAREVAEIDSRLVDAGFNPDREGAGTGVDFNNSQILFGRSTRDSGDDKAMDMMFGDIASEFAARGASLEEIAAITEEFSDRVGGIPQEIQDKWTNVEFITDWVTGPLERAREAAEAMKDELKEIADMGSGGPAPEAGQSMLGDTQVGRVVEAMRDFATNTNMAEILASGSEQDISAMSELFINSFGNLPPEVVGEAMHALETHLNSQFSMMNIDIDDPIRRMFESMDETAPEDAGREQFSVFTKALQHFFDIEEAPSLMGFFNSLVRGSEAEAAAAAGDIANTFGKNLKSATLDQLRTASSAMLTNFRGNITGAVESSVGGILDSRADAQKAGIAAGAKSRNRAIDDIKDAELDKIDDAFDERVDKAEKAHQKELENLQKQFGLHEEINKQLELEQRRREKIAEMAESEAQASLDVAAALAAGNIGQATEIRMKMIAERAKNAQELADIDKDAEKLKNQKLFDIEKDKLEGTLEITMDGIDDEFDLRKEALDDKIDLMREEVDAWQDAENERIDISLAANKELMKEMMNEVVTGQHGLNKMEDALRDTFNISEDIPIFTDSYEDLLKDAKDTLLQDHMWNELGKQIIADMGDGMTAGMDMFMDAWVEYMATGDSSVWDRLNTLVSGSASEGVTGVRLAGHGASGSFDSRHSGGYIDGTGASMPGLRSDETPTILQNGEYVIQRDAVRKMGIRNLDQINKMHEGGMVTMIGKTMAFDMFSSTATAVADAMLNNKGLPPGISSYFASLGALAPPDLDRTRKHRYGSWTYGLDPSVIKIVASGLAALPGGQSIVSAFRDKQHNKSVGGASNSDHMFGRAVDIVGSKGANFEELMMISNFFRDNYGSFLRWVGDPIVDPSGHNDHVHLSFKKNLPQMRDGGIVMNDNTLANLHKGEAVLTRPLTEELKSGAQGSGGVTLNIGEFHGTEDNIKKIVREVERVMSSQQRKSSRSRVVA